MDFIGLSDDQLIALIRAACADAIRRGDVVRVAAESAVLSEAEKAQISRDSAKRETENLRREEAQRVAASAAQKVRSTAENASLKAEREKQQQWWGKKKGLSRLVITLLGSGWSINVWERNSEQRVYLDGPNGKTATFYATGNNSHAPGTLACSKLHRDLRPFILEIVKRASSDWRSIKIVCEEAVEYSGPTTIEVPDGWVQVGEMRSEREVVEEVERTTSGLRAKISDLDEKAEAAAKEISAAEKSRLEGRYFGSYQESTLSASRAKMSEYAQQAADLKPNLDQAKAISDAARADFDLRFPQDKNKRKVKEDTGEE